MKIIFFTNGNTGVFNDQGLQIPKLQQSWLRLFIQYLESQDIIPTEAEYIMPNGKNIKIHKNITEYSWEIL